MSDWFKGVCEACAHVGMVATMQYGGPEGHELYDFCVDSFACDERRGVVAVPASPWQCNVCGEADPALCECPF